MKPEQLLDPESLPDDLRWLSVEFRLAPKDPVFLLIAWHWHRVQQAEDTLRAANVELQSAVDSRIEAIAGSAVAAEKLIEALRATKATLESGRVETPSRLEEEIRVTTETLRAAEKSFASLLARLDPLQARLHRNELLAALLAGVAVGVTGSLILVLA